MNHRQRKVLVLLSHNDILLTDYAYLAVKDKFDYSDTVYQLEELGLVTLYRDGTYKLTPEGAGVAHTIIETKLQNRRGKIADRQTPTPLFTDGSSRADHS